MSSVIRVSVLTVWSSLTLHCMSCKFFIITGTICWLKYKLLDPSLIYSSPSTYHRLQIRSRMSCCSLSSMFSRTTAFGGTILFPIFVTVPLQLASCMCYISAGTSWLLLGK